MSSKNESPCANVNISRLRKIKYLFFAIIPLFIYFIFNYFYSAQSENNKPVALATVNTVNLKSEKNPVNNIFSDFPEMVEIPEGSFQMGCNTGWDDKFGKCRANEKPPHRVIIKKFSMSKYETTVGQFQKFITDTHYLTTAEVTNRGCTIKNKEGIWVVSKEHNWKNPGFKQNFQHPVVCISWEDTYAYTSWLNKKTGRKYRLPSEEEWEYAARSGKKTAVFWDELPNRNYANYLGIAGKDKWEHTSPVGSLQGNWYELYDMSGNAWEWVEDCWRENYTSECRNEEIRIRRGGAWNNTLFNLRSSYRSKENMISRSYLYGFRVAHDID